MKSSAVYRRETKIIIHPWSKTKTGVLIATAPFFVFSGGGKDEELGEALLSALTAAQSGLPHPTDWSVVNRSFLAAVGSRSWPSFVKGTVNCLVVLKDAQIEIVPQVNRGPKDGFQDGSIQSLTLDSDSDAAHLGASLRKALDSAR
jgi:hypothetical protein